MYKMYALLSLPLLSFTHSFISEGNHDLSGQLRSCPNVYIRGLSSYLTPFWKKKSLLNWLYSGWLPDVEYHNHPPTGKFFACFYITLHLFLAYRNCIISEQKFHQQTGHMMVLFIRPVKISRITFLLPWPWNCRSFIGVMMFFCFFFSLCLFWKMHFSLKDDKKSM